jgi:glycosyltransferase involved in cell wall biosynthesis
MHPVKDHAFLVQACHHLKRDGISFSCLIAGDGPERPRVARLVADLGLDDEVQLLGHVPHERLHRLYQSADVVVLTSQSEGIPLVLMEAMACGTPVLAPAITGIPELVLDGQTGFLYEPGSLNDLVRHLREILTARSQLSQVRYNARQHILQHFHRGKNLARFAEIFLERIAPHSLNPETHIHADLVLQ